MTRQPWAAPRTRTHRSIPALPTQGRVTPPTNSPFPNPRLSFCTAFSRSPRTSCAFQSTRSRVLDTTYFFAPPSFRRSPGQRAGHQPGRGFRSRDDASLRPRYGTMIAAPVQCDVDGIAKGAHSERLPPQWGRPARLARSRWVLALTLEEEVAAFP